MVGFWRSAARRALACWAYREQRALAGRRGAGRPELDLLGYAPRSRRLAQLLGGLHGCSARTACASTALLGMPSVLQPASQHTRATRYYEKRPKPTERTGLLPKYFMPGRSRDLVERLDVSSRNVVERPVELLFEA